MTEVAVFLIATTAPCVLYWFLAAARGRGGVISTSMLVVCCAFGFGVAVIARAKGWV